ncbi:XRE family transcriptional regulator [Streptomyces nitrosporeus]|uniref:XRE family transcriptional regulator n=2 Tax=Streptomyces nitrosporeus TaxID=28894 RepID=A0A5J6F9U1_9ACTN|nr:helix-turn-helix transcriptional regulator [Streptomyces nitrosporeus]QEU73052.1 XRE family transcriptional regulator [Streptomyces nitrosporeus]GGZ17658.1 transcriptional regulator [Streptomyces nitrosporeus]
MFGALLRFFREQAGISQESLGARIRFSKSQVAMVERGERPPKNGFVPAADAATGAQGALITAGEKLNVNALPHWFAEFKDEEAGAVARHAYETHVVPGLLQTEPYARAVLSGQYPAFDDDEIEAKLLLRLARQNLLSRKPLPNISFVLEAAPLTRPIGGPHILREQLLHLREVAGLRHVQIQVMPPGRQSHPALDGPFVLLENAERRQLAYVEGQGGGFFITEQPALGDLFGKYGLLRAQAYTPEESLTMIEKMAEEL